MNKTRWFVFAFLMLAFSITALGQITIKVPKINQPKTSPTPSTNNGNTNNNNTNQTNNSNDLRKPEATDDPVFLKTTLDVRCDTENRYWKTPTESNYTSWVPQVKFKVFYNGSTKLRYLAEYFTPDGKLWFSETLETNMSDGNYQTVDLNSSRSGDRFTNKSTVAIGTYGVKITNQRDNSVVFEGKFKVNKYKYGNNLPMFKNQYSFYVEQDWNLPIGYVWLDYKGDQYAPLVKVGMWFKNDLRSSDFEGKLFYNGQEIATTDDLGEASNNDRRFPNVTENKELAYWQRWDFSWNKVRFKAGNGGMSYPNAKMINSMPGEYTLKVLFQGVQVREAKFSIANGNFVDNGIGKQNNFNDHKIIIPVKVMGTIEKWNTASWKTDAFYGNPLTGFSL